MKNKNNAIKDVSIEKLKKQLVVKKIKGKEYYYSRAKINIDLGQYRVIKQKESYLCPVDSCDFELERCYVAVRKKLFSEFFDFLYDFSKKTYSSEYIGEKERKLLEILRFGYNILLKEYGDSDLKRYENSVYVKYVYGTTSIEGNTYTLRETDLTLNEGLTVGGKEKREFYEIENYGKLKKYQESVKKIDINIRFIRKLHSLIMDNIDANSAGEFRRIDVGLTGTEYEPIPSLFVEEEMEKLVDWYKKNENMIHPVELASLFHQRFEEIHPFIDGNGRVGRELIRLMLEKNKYPTIFIDRTKREEYLKSLDEGNDGKHKRLVKFIVDDLLAVHDRLLNNAGKSLGENNSF
ncbi:MAG: Fic family protein [Candidatus Aenigmarchaeota archaeon]|nr:Fic family protein [Candidatus Aenigmarchaeota archaeon]